MHRPLAVHHELLHHVAVLTLTHAAADLQVVEWTRSQNSKIASSTQVSSMTLLFLRVFVLGMLGATASQLPSVRAFGAWAAQQPAVQELKRLQAVLGPLMGMLMG